jgi:MFS family permease
MIPKKAPPSAKDEFRRSWRVVLATMIGNCGSQLLPYSFGVFIDPISQGLGWSRSAISGFAFFWSVGYVLLASATGRLIDRIGVRPVVLVAIPLLSLAWASFSLLGGGVWTLYLAFLATGCIATGATIVPYSRAINSWFVAGRGTALGLMACGPGLASTFGPRIFQSIVDAHGWRTGFLVVGAAALVPWPVMALLLHERREAAAPGVLALETGYTRREAIRQPVFWLIAVASFFWLFAFGHVVHLVSFLTSSGLTRTEAATYAGVLGATSMLGRLVAGFVIDRVNVPLVCALVFFLQAAALVALGLFHAQFALVAIAVMGFSHGAENDCIPYLTAGYFGLKCFGEIFGLIVMATVLGSAVGPLAFGFMRDVSGAYSLPYLVMAAFAAGSAILISCVHRHPYLAEVARARR